MNKKRSLLTATTLAVLTLATGTFAWTSFSQRALNDVTKEAGIPGGRVHDDYSKESGNKDVYAENFGKQDILVRIKLSEYLEINDEIKVVDSTKDNKDSWQSMVSSNTTERPLDSYVNWTLGGDKVFLPTFNTDNTSLISDATGDGLDSITGTATAQGDGEHNTYVVDQIVENIDDPNTTHVAKNTIKEVKAPINMAEWKALPATEKVGDFWVIDTDGWAYWANKLQPTESTSLLLNQITLNNEALAGTKWYYGIDVLGQFVNVEDKGGFVELGNGGSTTDGQELIETIVDPPKESFTYRLEVPANTKMNFDTEQQFSAKVIKTSDQTGISEDVTTKLTWSLSGQSDGGNLGKTTNVDQTGKVYVKTFELEGPLTVEIKAPEFNLSGSFEIGVNTITVGTEFVFYGEQYIYVLPKGVANNKGNYQILRKDVLQDEEHNSLGYNGSGIDIGMRRYYGELKTAAKNVVQPVQKEFEVGQLAYSDSGLDSDKFKTTYAPDDFAVVTPDGEKKAFALSLSEINEMSGPGKAFETRESRTTKKTLYEVNQVWHLRTSASLVTGWTIGTDILGSVDLVSNTYSSNLRPSLIIEQ